MGETFYIPARRWLEPALDFVDSAPPGSTIVARNQVQADAVQNWINATENKNVTVVIEPDSGADRFHGTVVGGDLTDPAQREEAAQRLYERLQALHRRNQKGRQEE